jgi:hypothetical protein
MCDLDADACRRLAAAILLRAVLDAWQGDSDAREWLAGLHAAILAEALGIRLRMDRLPLGVTSMQKLQQFAHKVTLDILEEYLRKDPNATIVELAVTSGIAPGTVSEYIGQLQLLGRLSASRYSRGKKCYSVFGEGGHVRSSHRQK